MTAPAALPALARTAAARKLAQRRRPRKAGSARTALIGIALVLSLPLVLVTCVASIASDGSTAAPLDPEAAELAGIPQRAAVAYQRGAARCPGLTWTRLAAVGAVESHHGEIGGATIDENTGDVVPWIFGPSLDGGGGTAAIPIGEWVDWWGLTGPWTQAVGPMQFLPATFETHTVDGNGDAVTNPHNIDDAVATAANYICTAGGEWIESIQDIATVYNPGSPTYADQLAVEEQRILDALPAPNVLNAGTGSSTCPVSGPVDFTDTWGAPRSGGRSHEGVDMFAPAGTPVVAPASGTVEHYDNNLGGLSYRLYGDDGTYYYGTHLSGYENVGAGQVSAGTVIGYVGTTGNAASTPPHLHWEIHPNGRGSGAINPTPTAEILCSSG